MFRYFYTFAHRQHFYPLDDLCNKYNLLNISLFYAEFERLLIEPEGIETQIADSIFVGCRFF